VSRFEIQFKERNNEHSSDRMTDEKLMNTLRRLWTATDNRPDDMTVVDLGQVTRLLLQRADEAIVGLAQTTIAADTATSVDTIAKSQRRLKKRGWLTIRKGGYRGRVNLYSVNIEALPLGDYRKVIASPDATRFAAKWGVTDMTSGKRRFMSGWQSRWAVGVQRLIDRTGGDFQKMIAVVNHARASQQYTKTARRGPTALSKYWKKLLAEYEAKTAVTQLQTVPERQIEQPSPEAKGLTEHVTDAVDEAISAEV
jgi:hypothetical protein